MNRLLFLGILLYGLALTGLIVLSGNVLLLVIPVALYLGMALLYGPDDLKLELSRTLSADRIVHGTAVQVELTIVNKGGVLEEVEIIDHPPAQLSVLEGNTAILTSLAPGETVTLTYTLDGRRGYYDFGEIAVTATDRFGLFRKQMHAPAEGKRQFFVLPKVIKLKRIDIRPRQTKVYAGTIPARLGGSGVEFFGVREYQAGDSLRHMNWQANARHPSTLHTNEFEQERVADVGLILDARLRSNHCAGTDALFDFSIQAAAALTEAFLTQGNRVGLLQYGDFLGWTFPGYGKIQKERILQALARARVGDSMVFDRLEHLPTRLFPPKSQVVLISPLMKDDVRFIKRLRARGFQLLVVSPDPVAFARDMLGANKPEVQLAYRIARLERALLLRQLQQSGIFTIDWQVTTPFEQSVGMALSGLPIWSRHAAGLH
ncbi:MAG: DUF58 domain-containing protein [Candidatus Promineifilaceae bacterium]